MAIVDDLLEHPGLYLGLDRHSDPGHPGAARILVTPLPGRAGVTLDYEVLNPAQPDRIRGHHEHTVLARTHDGGAVLVVGHIHAESVAILQETEPGTFELERRWLTLPDEGRAVDAGARTVRLFVVVRRSGRGTRRARRRRSRSLDLTGRATAIGCAGGRCRRRARAAPTATRHRCRRRTSSRGARPPPRSWPAVARGARCTARRTR